MAGGLCGRWAGGRGQGVQAPVARPSFVLPLQASAARRDSHERGWRQVSPSRPNSSGRRRRCFRASGYERMRSQERPRGAGEGGVADAAGRSQDNPFGRSPQRRHGRAHEDCWRARGRRATSNGRERGARRAGESRRESRRGEEAQSQQGILRCARGARHARALCHLWGRRASPRGASRRQRGGELCMCRRRGKKGGTLAQRADGRKECWRDHARDHATRRAAHVGGAGGHQANREPTLPAQRRMVRAARGACACHRIES